MARTKVSASGRRTTKGGLSQESASRLQSQIDKAKVAVEGLTSSTSSTAPARPSSARGDDFAEGFGAEGLGIVDRTGGSVNDAIDVGAGRKTESQVRSGAAAAARERARQIQAEVQRKRRAEKRAKRLKGGRLATDNLRATQTDLVQDEAVTTQGARSSRVLTDEEIDEYASRGFTEGDFVPGEGTITPYGTFDTTEVDRQNALTKAQEEAQRIQAQLDNMRAREDADEFEGVASDEPVVQQEQNAISKLNEPDTIISGALQLLQQQEENIQKQLDAEIKAAKQSYEMARGDTEDKQARESGQLSVSLANAGGYLGFTGSGTGVMLTLTKSHRAEMDRLKLERDRAISVARQNAAENRFDVVREQAQLVERLENEAYERQVAYQEEMQAAADKQAEEAQRSQTEQSIFALIKQGVRTPQDIYEQLGGSVPIADVNEMLTSFLPDGLKGGGGFKFTASNTAALLGTGLSQDDILALNEYVNDNGYDDKVRSSLTASQRVAADKIFKTTTGSGGLGKVMPILDLDRIEESYGVRFPFGVTEGEVTQFFEDNAGADPDELQAALDSLFGGGGSEASEDEAIDFNFINDEMTDAQKKALADKVGASRWYTPAGMDVDRLLADPTYLEEIKNLSEADLLDIFSS